MCTPMSKLPAADQVGKASKMIQMCMGDQHALLEDTSLRAPPSVKHHVILWENYAGLLHAEYSPDR